jgi:hypothetical protein
MKFNQWTIALAAAGVVSLGSVGMAEEAQHQVLTALSSTTLSGYVSTSAIWKFGTGGPGNVNMPGRSFDGAGKQDGFNLDVVKLTLEKPLDEGQWAAGYRVDILAGPDAGVFNALAATGNTFGAGGGASIEQAYVNMRAPVGNGLDFKMGVFDALMGYESFDSYKNPNFSRSYGYYIDPKQHTGIIASYQVTDILSVAGGVANTYFGPINGRAIRPTGIGGANVAAESEKTYLGSIAITAPESFGFLKGATLYAGIVDGLGAGSATDITGYYVGATVPTPMEGLAVGASYDYRGNTSQGNFSSSYANATALYVSYQATEKLKFNNRFEYASATSGTFTGVNTAINGVAAVKPPGGEEFFADTFTVDYSLWANVISRLEFRWDHDLTARRGALAPFGNDDKNAISLALNVIYKF